MAVDRGNEMLSSLYQSFHPSILNLVKKSVEAGHKRNIKVSVCGEMAADPLGAVVLAGLGVDILSVNFQSVGIVKKVIRSVTNKGLKKLAEKALTMKTQDEIIEYLYDGVINDFPDLKDVIHFMRKKNV
jgi:phosphotransferase system enzyme I (PtsI)